MACESITAYAKECSSVAGGVQKLWLINYADLTSYTTSETTGEVTAMVLGVGKSFKSIGIIKNTVGITETFTKTVETGTSEITTELTLVVSQITTSSRKFVQSLANGGEIIAVIQLRSGNKIVAGLDGGLEVTSVVGGSGVAGGDLNGYTITFSGIENEFLRLVASSVKV